MELNVYTNTTIREVREQFSRYFPYLKLEFFICHRQAKDNQFKKEVYKGLYLEETTDLFREGIIHFSPSTTLAELEMEFQIQTGLVARIYRRAGDVWTDAAQTAHLSLARQNNMGADMPKFHFNLNTLFL